MTKIQVIRNGEVLAESCAEKEAQLLYRGAYQLGEELRFETD